MEAKLSKGNTKLGTLANISLPPVATCDNRCGCCRGRCYALKSERMYAATRAMRAHNLAAFQADEQAYFRSILAQTIGSRFFRWHVAGDCPTPRYLEGVIAVAHFNPETKYLLFTKRYSWVNRYLDSGATIPGNLAIVFSAWPGFEMFNPHGMPVAFMRPRHGSEERLTGREIECPGNCETCGTCWSLGSLKRNVVFAQH